MQISEETRKKLSEAKKKEWAMGLRKSGMLGKHHSEETKRKMSSIMMGRKISEETRGKLSKSHKGYIMPESQKEKIKNALIGRIISEEWKRKIGLANKGNIMPKDEKSHKWKGNNVGYRGLHMWVYKWLGRPCKCKFCGKIKDTPKSIHWANRSGKYLRNLTDWIQLCVRCHKEYDRIVKVNSI